MIKQALWHVMPQGRANFDLRVRVIITLVKGYKLMPNIEVLGFYYLGA
jgi:hypothetical protein